MIKKTFKRYEYKYILDSKKLQAILDGIAPYVEADKYCIGGKKYSLYNIYYDTQDYSVIRHSVSKPAFKEKLRLRSYYENPSDDDKVFVELKKKADGCVNKRRAVLSYKDALELINTGKGKKTGVFVNDQVVKEIEYYIKTHPVCHKTYLAYDRLAFFLKEDKNIRITFDSNLRAGPAELGEAGAKPVVDGDTFIMEIKISDHIPLWLARLMTENNVFRHGFSKYGTYYTNTILPERIKEYVKTV